MAPSFKTSKIILIFSTTLRRYTCTEKNQVENIFLEFAKNDNDWEVP
ncbi:hypothetical protein HMPREF0519_0031 [Lentilactobacillus hilgardii DSM 20176 = ATCC 8290]|uniref:Uncharacterized protein n=1 Tax=Lentilactobacillus hilgardii (strain ATCC 8290 / DSM 20176 / CCUG 30140 / JCM 1155 / KCTC 3500 / NBRC 15886 / NCIMB 8040 / NRRL B-1843 / 9) TaxID=1423757 RepID=C0XFM0_LENH9|nr:hypothetical protein HMPREF0519_0031 [Lentilactobacillus hilgardii DSM 20176 = ATCC 8290]